ncbi:MAG: hypothetical protein ACXW5W_19700, partial [Candidatus Binatia bacterium]
RTHGSEGGDGESRSPTPIRFVLRRISLDTRFRGYDGAPQALCCAYHPAHLFSKEDMKSTKFGILTIRTIRALHGEQNKSTLTHIHTEVCRVFFNSN